MDKEVTNTLEYSDQTFIDHMAISHELG